MDSLQLELLVEAVIRDADTDDYVSPDELFNYALDYVTFLYSGDMGLFWGGLSHGDLVVSNPQLEEWLEDHNPYFDPESGESWEWLGKHFLVGRAGELGEDLIVSFWNEEDDIYDSLGACLSELESYKLISTGVPVQIHTPHGIRIYRGDTVRGGGTELSPEQRRKLNLQKRLHLMRGQEKREAMKELGLWADKPAKHPWQAGLERTGEIGPGQKWWTPHSESIGPLEISALISEDLTTENELVTPDDILGHRSITFIYTKDHRLYATNGDDPHDRLESEISREDKDFARYLERAWSKGREGGVDAREFMEAYIGLYGRVGYWGDQIVVAFWNEKSEIYDSLLANCLKHLEDEGFLPSDETIEIHTPLDITSYTPGQGETRRQGGTTPEQQRRYELQRRLHLATGQEKRAIRKELGLWTDKPGKHSWQAGLEKAGEIGPGQKWWTPRSEQIESIARTIEEDV